MSGEAAADIKVGEDVEDAVSGRPRGLGDRGRSVGPLEITGITATPIRVALPREFRGSHYHMTHRSTIIVQVTTADGPVGEAYVGDEDHTLLALRHIVEDEIAPSLLGSDAFLTERCWRSAYPATFDILRDRRLGLVAVAGVDAAIWDAVGKALNIPLWKLWGGSRSAVPMIAIGGYYGEPLGSIAEEIAAYRELGLAGMKFKIGGASPDVDVNRVAAARDAAGPDWILAVDANQGYTRDHAIEVSRRLEELDIRWFEEPVRWTNDHASMRDIRFRGRIPVCAGQSEFSPAGCRDMMEMGAIDVCNFDSSWSGGPTVWRRVAAIAESYDVQMAHHEEPQIASHLIGAAANGTYAECFHPDRDPFWWNLIANRPPLQDGMLTLPDGPGLGWELDWDYIQRHRVAE
ncbi:mandelate racemase/muconate lactonizing enzyme family protein [Mycolicibacterium sp.]|uniref:mandelate racemase/muconate lactonizing enzyme family protein n=1 Tax=Mycolicibacterium sp. TaxID=2320850 RepID=UPI003D0E8098